VTGRILLQGGAEFGAACAEMDAALVEATRLELGGEPRIVVTTLAGSVGRDYETATAHGVAYYRSLGAVDVSGAPDVRVDAPGALEALEAADLVVLPGGSPSRLLRALTGTPVGPLLPALLARGGSISGASAGAMVLGAWTVLPEEHGPSGVRVVPGLGLVAGIAVVPHFQAGSSGPPRWAEAIEARSAGAAEGAAEGAAAGAAERAAEPGVELLALPECSGVLVDDRGWTPLGAADSVLFAEGTLTPLPRHVLHQR
jgi:cyanophycinase-like exopeptidase